MPYDPEVHHRRSIRLRGYDYAQAGAYFVTVCVQNRECLFGEVADGAVPLDRCGEIVARCWDELPSHYPTVELDAFVIMPNHVHGIIVLAGQSEREADARRWRIDGHCGVSIMPATRAVVWRGAGHREGVCGCAGLASLA